MLGKMSWIRFIPQYKERVWGGRNLETFLDRSLPGGKVIGESWEIVDRPEAQSVLDSADYVEQTLRELIEEKTLYVMGPDWRAEDRFPILVKWLDCQERLSLQVHPPAEIASELNGEPKTENWYIARSVPGAGLLAGLVRGTTRERFEQALKDLTLESCVHRIPVSEGDSLLVRSGRIHAIDAGNMILEIQQNSDTTYRVYDWGRLGLDGKPREMHVEESMKSIDFKDFEPDVLRKAPGSYLLAECREFRIQKYVFEGPEDVLHFGANTDTRLLHVIDGIVEDMVSGKSAIKGTNLLMPYGAEYRLCSPEGAEFLITDQFRAR